MSFSNYFILDNLLYNFKKEEKKKKQQLYTSIHEKKRYGFPRRIFQMKVLDFQNFKATESTPNQLLLPDIGLQVPYHAI